MLKPDEVTDNGLQIEIGNLKAENERLQTEYSKLLASSHIVTEKLREEVREVRSQLAAEQNRFKELDEEFWNSQELLSDRDKIIAELRSELKGAQSAIEAQRGKIHNLERGYGFEETATEKILRRQIRDLEQQLADLKQKSASAGKEFPEAADLLNQLKAKRKKSKTDLADMEAILDILED